MVFEQKRYEDHLKALSLFPHICVLHVTMRSLHGLLFVRT